MKKTNKTKLALNRETLATLDPVALTDVNGGAGTITSVYICVSNATGGRSCSYCPGK